MAQVSIIIWKIFFVDILNALWKIEDSVVNSKRCFVESIEQWNTKLTESMKKKDTEKKKDKDKTVLADSESSAVSEVNLSSDKTESSDTLTNDSLAAKKSSEGKVFFSFVFYRLFCLN